MLTVNQILSNCLIACTLFVSFFVIGCLVSLKILKKNYIGKF